MKAMVIYYSRYGNTKRIAEAISEVLSQSGNSSLVNLDHFTPDKLADVDLLVMGSPTYYQMLPQDVRSVLQALPKNSMKGKWAATFDTSLKMWEPIMLLTSAHRLMSKLRKLGGKKVIGPETFLVTGSETPQDGSNSIEIDLLMTGEFERAKSWALEILENMLSRGKR